LSEIRESKPDLAKLVLEQVFDDAMAVAGMMDEARVMVPRLNKLLLYALEGGEAELKTEGKGESEKTGAESTAEGAKVESTTPPAQ